MIGTARFSAPVRYGFGLLGASAALGLRWLLLPALGSNAPYVTFYLAVVVVAFFAGLGPAILTSALGAVSAAFFFLEPQNRFALPPEHALWIVFYSLICGTIIGAIELHARAAALALRRLSALQAEQGRRVAAEHEAEERNRWARQTLSSIGDGVITTDAGGRITFVNRVAAELTKWDPALAVGQPIEKVFHIVNEQTGAVVESPVSRVLREGVVVGLANHTALIRKDGSMVPIDDSGAPIRDESGETVGAVLVFRDFAERRRQEEANARLAAVIHYSHDAIISKSLDGVIQTWNPGAERLFGYTEAEAIGLSMTALVPPERMHEESGIIETVRAGRDIQHFETVRLRKDGAPVQVSMSVSPLYDTYGALTGVSHIARDVTEQKLLHAQLLQAQKLESIGVLAGGVAHDFNNLLTGIIGSASLLLDMLPPDGAEPPLLEHILKAGERAAQLTQQLLAYSGRGRFIVQQLDPSVAIRDIVDLVRASIPRSAEVVLELADSLPLIEVDVAQFQQLVMNLVINGAEAMNGKTGTVRVSTALSSISSAEIGARKELKELVPGQYVSVRVEDAGCGMTPETLARIFEPFFTTKFTGRGLGLAAVTGIVRSHRGAMRVDSAPGKGTRFEVLLPVASKAANA